MWMVFRILGDNVCILEMKGNRKVVVPSLSLRPKLHLGTQFESKLCLFSRAGLRPAIFVLGR